MPSSKRSASKQPSASAQRHAEKYMEQMYEMDLEELQNVIAIHKQKQGTPIKPKSKASVEIEDDSVSVGKNSSDSEESDAVQSIFSVKESVALKSKIAAKPSTFNGSQSSETKNWLIRCKNMLFVYTDVYV